MGMDLFSLSGHKFLESGINILFFYLSKPYDQQLWIETDPLLTAKNFLWHFSIAWVRIFILP